jgi:hypothetical protein
MRRSFGKRELRRAYRRDVVRVIELADKGFKPSTVAATVGIDAGLVALILEQAGAVREGEGGR